MITGPSSSRRVSLRGLVRVAAEAEQALDLFTPAGEQLWVEGWQPLYPAGTTDGAGTVFVTANGGHETIWVLTDHGRRRIRYARITPGRFGGLVEVRCHEQRDGSTCAIVSYELTALSEAACEELAALERDFPGRIAEWERRIAAVIRDGAIVGAEPDRRVSP